VINIWFIYNKFTTTPPVVDKTKILPVGWKFKGSGDDNYTLKLIHDKYPDNEFEYMSTLNSASFDVIHFNDDHWKTVERDGLSVYEEL